MTQTAALEGQNKRNSFDLARWRTSSGWDGYRM
jgi:hypothetical protein